MASESVKKILSAESESERKINEARIKSNDILTEAEKYASIALQKKLTEAKTKYSNMQKANEEKLSDYRKIAEKKCSREIGEINRKAQKNTDKAINAVINGFFS